MTVCARQPCICAGSIHLCAWILHLGGLKHRAQIQKNLRTNGVSQWPQTGKNRHMIPNRANEKTSRATVSCVWHRGNGRVLQTRGLNPKNQDWWRHLYYTFYLSTSQLMIFKICHLFIIHTCWIWSAQIQDFQVFAQHNIFQNVGRMYVCQYQQEWLPEQD